MGNNYKYRVLKYKDYRYLYSLLPTWGRVRDTSWTGEEWAVWNCVPNGWGGKKEWKSTKCPPLVGGPKSLISRRGKKSCHYASWAECGAACRIDWLPAGLVGRLGGTFNARRRKQMEHRLIQSDVVILNTRVFAPSPNPYLSQNNSLDCFARQSHKGRGKIKP